MAGAVVAGCCYALFEASLDSGAVELFCVDGVGELGFVREGDLLQPGEEVDAAAEAALRPLWGVCVRVYEARDEEFGGGEGGYGGCVGVVVCLGEKGWDVGWVGGGVEGLDLACCGDDEEGVWQDFQGLGVFAVD